MVKNICSRFGIEPSDGVTKLAYIESGNVYILASDEQLTTFLQSVAGLDPPTTLYVYDDVTTGNDVSSEENREDNSNIGDQHVYAGTHPPPMFPRHNKHQKRLTQKKKTTKTKMKKKTKMKSETSILTIMYTKYLMTFMIFPLTQGQTTLSSHPTKPYGTAVVKKLNYTRVFRMKGDLTLALGLKFLQEGFEFRTPRSCKKRYEAICAQKNCGWRIYASCLGGSTMFQVRTLNDVHMCSRTQMHSAHRNASRRVLSHLLLDKTDDVRRDLRAADIIKDMKAQHKINVSYWQAWRAKWQAINMIEGDPEDSFTRLPLYFYNLELNNPGTQTRIVVGNDGRFVSCFCALGCSIVTFRSGLLRKVIIIDGAHLKGRYSGTMFLAVAMDGNNQVVSIAIGVAKSESGEHWTWFLSMLRECIGEMEGLVFMSDRAAAIHQAINTVYPNAHHALCCRHLFMNIKAKSPNIDDNKTLFWKTCKANTAHEFEFQMVKGAFSRTEVQHNVLEQCRVDERTCHSCS
ncbi:hypothetical protein OSB04_000523 [Centaurea solstitialis]|uniref:MULE transposase domain-containing protein n=1 Tax=Centaurea solstitialis TaxID=347529 RepID=A0AA38WKL7_9ASTR|nr:hypothetical protein OSB04_000523 [Centaurea solstitialis]